jgi:capsular polysaccharide export protein
MRYTIYSVSVFLQPLYRRLIPALGGRCRLLQETRGQRTLTEYADGKQVGKVGTFQNAHSHLEGTGLVTWNGLLPCYARVVAEARRRGMRTAILEGGALRATYQVDPQGTNGASTIVGLTPERITAYPKADDTLYAQQTFTPRTVNVPDCRTPLPGDLALPRRYVLLPMQTHGDTQLTHFCAERWRSMPCLLRDVVAALPPGVRLVVKEHPWEMQRDHYEAMRAEFPQVTWCRTRDMDSLLAGARLVVTVNSTVGVQAMLRRLPVVTLGLAFYSKSGLVADGTRDLPATIAACLKTPRIAYDAELRARFLTYLRNEYLIPEADTGRLARRIGDIFAGRSPWLEVL